MRHRHGHTSNERGHARDVAAHLLLRTVFWVVVALVAYFCYTLTN